jgi:hypothetical protein
MLHIVWLASQFLRAVGTKSNYRKVGKSSCVAEQMLDQLAYRIQLRRRDRAIGGTPLARQVLALAGHGQRVQSGAVAEVDVPDDARILECLEIAVHRRDVRAWHAAADAFRDLLRRHRPIGGQQRLDHQATRRRHASHGDPCGGSTRTRCQRRQGWD